MTETASFEKEVRSGDRFEFGRNWLRFVDAVDEPRIEQAEASLREMLGVDSLAGREFLDVGCGSGLFSLAARRLGAEVTSFDYDVSCVHCAQALRSRWLPDDDDGWDIVQGSVLDTNFLAALPRYDIVYSWGVLHHTGDMANALANVAEKVANDGMLFIAIYNDQGRHSRSWLRVKQLYNRWPKALRWMVVAISFVPTWGPTMVRDLLHGQPFRTWRARQGCRGMSPICDLIDWVGGLPFEVAKPEEIFDLYRTRGFQLQRLKTCAGGKGCNEFVFRRNSRHAKE